MASLPEPTAQFCPLPDLSCIAVRGADARSFLNAQLSVDLQGIGPGRAPLAAWHTARGRVRAVIRVVPQADGWLLLGPRESAPTLLRQLTPFVLRSSVALSEDESVGVGAIVGADAGWLSAHGVPLEDAPDAALAHDGALWLRVGPRLVHVLGTAGRLEQVAARLPSAPAERAALAEIRLGIPRIGAALAERYLPQMLNLDRLAAVSFDKGCYPGQEVIARTHHLGSVKRRLKRFAGTGSSPPTAGTSVMDSEGKEVGEVVCAAAADSGFELLAVVRLDALDTRLSLAAQPDAPLTLLPLPYEE